MVEAPNQIVLLQETSTESMELNAVEEHRKSALGRSPSPVADTDSKSTIDEIGGTLLHCL